MRRGWVLVAALLVARARAASAHGDVHARIEALSAELAEHPDDADAWLERGSAFGLDDDWSVAADDFEVATSLRPGDADPMRRLANARLHTGEPDVAAFLLDAVVGAAPTDAEARLLRARARRALGRADEADGDYAAAIDAYASPAPHLYLERADDALERGRTDLALEVLRAGVERVGPVITLVGRIADLEEQRGDPAAALRALDRLPSAVQGSPSTDLRRGRLLVAAGQVAEGRAALTRALETIDAMPAPRRESDAMRALRSEVVAERGAATPPPVPASLARRTPFVVGVALALAGAGIFSVLRALGRGAFAVRRGRPPRRIG